MKKYFRSYQLSWSGTFILITLVIFSIAACGGGGGEKNTTQNVIPAENAPAKEMLTKVTSWMYQIQGLDEDGAIEALAVTNYPLLVLEPGHNFKDGSTYDTQSIINSLRIAPNGLKRLLLAYIDIGQAEDYRDYWGSSWVAPTATQPGSPDFLVTIDPDGWSGNYTVAYWKTEWKDLWLGDSGIVATLAKMGFDGIYLDWVEAYDDEKVIEAATLAGVDPNLEMITFIEELGKAGDAITKGFIVVPQNAPYLIDSAPKRYAAAIDGLAVEDTWFHGAGDAEWNDTNAGDLHERHDEEWSTENRLLQYKKYQNYGLPVFSVDYCISTDNANSVYTDATVAGLIPLVTRVSLSRLTETPPPALSNCDKKNNDDNYSSAWSKASLTWYESYPDYNSEECIQYNGCEWAGRFAAIDEKMPESWVMANNIIAVHSKDFNKYKLKTFRIKQGDRQIDATVYDMCSDTDCNGCCTENCSGTGFLIDIEKYTMQRFGSGDGIVEWICIDCQ